MGTGARIVVRAQTDAAWMKAGKCRDTGLSPKAIAEVMHPNAKEDIPRAKQICKGCPVREECLEFAQANRFDQGVWGGYDGDERYRLRRNEQRRASQAYRRKLARP